MIKTLLTFLFVFLFLLGLGQTLDKTDEKKQERYIKRYESLIEESKTIDLKKLEKIVLKTIDESKLKKDNLVFIIKDLNAKFAFEIDAYEHVPSMVINPYFNQATFWTEKNVKYLVKKFKKNLIPSKSDYFNVFLNYNGLKNLDNKIFAKELSNQKLGNYKKEEDGKITQKEFLYFP